ncbi:MAG: cytochrome c nitrite reductase small subunit [bacterium]|nr:cytochrome c nitrite reductase small subunit [bacterium]
MIAAALALSLTAGAGLGVGIFTFVYGRGASYLTNNPEACANCHVMRDHFDAWRKSSHHAVAVCNDCHTPASLAPKYLTKGLNGYHHSMAFTLKEIEGPIRITERNRAVTEQACRRCHAEIVQAVDPPHGGGDNLSCIRCHASVGHLE